MLQGTPSHELDRIIDAATAAQATLRRMLDGMDPDENGVVTVTTEAAAAAASELYRELANLIDVGSAVAGTVEDLHPATAESTAALEIVTERIGQRLDRSSVGHTDGELVAVDDGDAPDEEDASVAVEITPADEPPPPPSYYGV